MELEDRLREMGNLLRKTRTDRGHTAREVALSVDIAPAYLSMIELGHNPKTKKPSRPSADVLTRLAEFLMLPPAQLLALAGYTTSPDNSGGRKVSQPALPASNSEPKVEWGPAPAVNEQFRGRDDELEKLRRWCIEDHGNVVAICGQAGIGKTSLAVKFVEMVIPEFDFIMWTSLALKPRLKDVLRDFAAFVAPHEPLHIPDDEYQQLGAFLEILEAQRCLLILDNAESLLRDDIPGAFEERFIGYDKLIRRVGESRQNQSCLILTSRIEPRAIGYLAGKDASVQSLMLPGLTYADGQGILHDKGLAGAENAERELIDLYRAVPLNLKLVAEWIKDLFDGDIARFLKHVQETNEIVFGDLREVLEQQYKHLTEEERDVLIWLAILREHTSLETLMRVSIQPMAKDETSQRIESLLRRSLIEKGTGATFTLQPAIMDYVLEIFIKLIGDEIIAREYRRFSSHALMLAQTKEELRLSQVRLILEPIAKRLTFELGDDAIEARLRDYLATLRAERMPKRGSGYGAGNVLNLLLYMQRDLRRWDFSQLTIRQAYCQGISLPEVDFSGAFLHECIFTETFGSVLGIDFSHRGDLFAVGTADGEVRIWKADGTPYRSFDGHTNWVWAVAFSPDDRILASGSDDKTVCLWNVATNSRLHELTGHDDWVRTVAFNAVGTLLATGSDDTTIRIWDVATGKSLKTLHGHKGHIWAVAFSQDDKTLASGSDDQTVRLWDVTDLEHVACVKTLHGSDRSDTWARIMAFAANSTQFATGSEKNYDVHLWDVASDKRVRALHGHDNWVWAADFRPDGKVLASGSDDQTVRLWNAKTGSHIATLPGHSSRVWSVKFNHDGTRLASGSDDHTLRLWDVPPQQPERAQPTKTLHGFSNWINAVVFSPNGKYLASGSDDHSVRLWDISDSAHPKQHRAPLWGHSSWVSVLAFSHNGEYLASGSDDQTIRVWRVSTGQCLMVLAGHTNWIRALAFSANDMLLFSASDDQTVRLWKISSDQQLILPLDATSSSWVNSVWLNSVAFNDNGTMLASGIDGHSVQVWNVRESVQPRGTSLRGHLKWIKAVAFNPTSTLLATGSDDHRVRLWDVHDGMCHAVLGDRGEGHSSRVWAVAFNRDGSMLASSSDDRTIVLWHITEATADTKLTTSKFQSLHTPGLVGSWSSTIAFSPDGTLLAGGDKAGTIMLWDVAAGTLKSSMTGDRPYEGMNINDVRGLTEGQKATLRTLGAAGN